MKIVLLPGMDGSGLLFEPFMAQASSRLNVVPLTLKQAPNLSYEEQSEYILRHIGNEAVVIVAESYSGMVAYQIAQKSPENIKHIVFAASFLSRPSPVARFAPYLPLGLIKNSVLPKSLIGRVVFGNFASDRLLDLLYESLAKVEDSVIQYRLRQVSRLQPPGGQIEIPCTYIRPKNDNLVAKKAARAFEGVCRNLSFKEIAGSHFILQTNPAQCWDIINKIVT